MLAALSIINSLIVYLLEIRNLPFAFGFTQWIDGTTGTLTSQGLNPTLHFSWLLVDILIAVAFAGFGWFARKGSDLAFVVGMFLYVVDAMLAIGLREFWGFGFHLIGSFLHFQGTARPPPRPRQCDLILTPTQSYVGDSHFDLGISFKLKVHG